MALWLSLAPESAPPPPDFHVTCKTYPKTKMLQSEILNLFPGKSRQRSSPISAKT
jgi:hypothetical protein